MITDFKMIDEVARYSDVCLIKKINIPNHTGVY